MIRIPVGLAMNDTTMPAVIPRTDPLPHRAGPRVWVILSSRSARLDGVDPDRRRVGDRGGRCRPRSPYADGSSGSTRWSDCTPPSRDGGLRLFGTSRHLIVNPDAATCAMIAASHVRAGRPIPELLLSLSVVWRSLRRGCCVLRRFRSGSGFLADFLSRPDPHRLSRRRGHQHLSGPDRQGVRVPDGARTKSSPLRSSSVAQGARCRAVPALTVGLLTIVVMVVSKRSIAPVAWSATGRRGGDRRSEGRGTSEAAGVAVVGDVPAGSASLHWPTFDPQFLQPLFGGALGVLQW